MKSLDHKLGKAQRKGKKQQISYTIGINSGNPSKVLNFDI